MVSNKPHILIFDNEPISSHILSRVLAAEYRVQRVPDANHILDAVRRPDRKPDLILLGVSPPGGDAFEICRQIKGDEMTQSVPVMLITQGNHAEEEVRGFKLGAADCISRPFRLDLVKARIHRQLRLKINNDLLARYANQDWFTDIANRRRFDLALDAEWRRAMRDVKPLSLLLVAVDCFKQYKDLYGHLEGDQCLRRIAGAMAQALTRPGDLLARYGGEEFAVILPGTDLDGARLMGERLRDTIAEMQIPLSCKEGAGRVTISVGCACERPTQAQVCHQLILTADNQLHAAKNAGRDCVMAGNKFT